MPTPDYSGTITAISTPVGQGLGALPALAIGLAGLIMAAAVAFAAVRYGPRLVRLVIR